MADRQTYIGRLRNRGRVLNYDERLELANLVERDAAVLEALSSDGAIEAAADAHERRCAQLHAPTHRESAKVVLRVALQHAQEQVGEDRGD